MCLHPRCGVPASDHYDRETIEAGCMMLAVLVWAASALLW